MRKFDKPVRYDLEPVSPFDEDGSEMKPNETGEYVEYKDYEALAIALCPLLAKLSADFESVHLGKYAGRLLDTLTEIIVGEAPDEREHRRLVEQLAPAQTEGARLCRFCRVLPGEKHHHACKYAPGVYPGE